MDAARLEEIRQQARLRERHDEDRLRKIGADLRLQRQERQAQDEARAAMPLAEEQHYAHLPRPSYAGVR
ncbi:hypothetical protein LRE75_33380 [Streptomyces sp. 372A]